jgi:DNA processing protein
MGIAQTLAGELAERGVTVVSGLARGIDAAAHHGALAAGGRTVAVVGTGLRRAYPPEHAALQNRIAKEGAVVSQFWPHAPPTRYSFPMRNAVMSGISQGPAVIEASATSGAGMQARRASRFEQGKRAFLMASLVTREQWAQRYLERGAIEVHSVEDILRWLRTPASTASSAPSCRQRSAGRPGGRSGADELDATAPRAPARIGGQHALGLADVGVGEH